MSKLQLMFIVNEVRLGSDRGLNNETLEVSLPAEGTVQVLAYLRLQFDMT